MGERIAIVDAGPVMSLLYLNNNLHFLHHESPGAAWYRLPALWRARRGEVLATNGHYCYRSYGEVIRRFALDPREPVAWPIN